MISESTIDKVRELPIETVVGQYVKLAKDGRTSMKGFCPFHSENTPSFSINLNKNLYPRMMRTATFWTWTSTAT